jgi:hypothetical protein
MLLQILRKPMIQAAFFLDLYLQRIQSLTHSNETENPVIVLLNHGQFRPGSGFPDVRRPENRVKS